MASVALVVLDTVRADSFSARFDWLDGTWFENAYSTSHWTIPAHASLFTGQYPSEVGVYGTSPALDCPETTLAEALSDAGVRTRSLTANTQICQYDGWDRGFDTFDGPGNLARADDSVLDWDALVEETSPGTRRYLDALWRCLAGECDTRESLRYGYRLLTQPDWDGGARAVRDRLPHLDVGDDDFLFVNLMDAHTPYRPPDGGSDPVNVVIGDVFADAVDDPDYLRAAYDASVADLAGVYRDIYARLDEDFDYVVTLSDHGELLGEHGLWNHSISLHPELVHVPLVVQGPGFEDGVRESPVNLLDVHQTVAALLDVDVSSRGRDLRDPLTPRPLLVESHGLLPFHESQFERTGAPMSAFDRWQCELAGYVDESGAYCYESEPGAFATVGDPVDPDPQVRLDALVDELDRREVEVVETDVSDAVRDRLEQLGYA